MGSFLFLSFFFFTLVCISYFQKPCLEKKKKKGKRGGEYFAGRFLGDELACGDGLW